MTPTKEHATNSTADSPAADPTTPTRTTPDTLRTDCPRIDFGNCTASEARVLILVMVDDQTQAAAARILRCSRANISQTLTRALRKIRKAVGAQTPAAHGSSSPPTRDTSGYTRNVVGAAPPHRPATTTPTEPQEPQGPRQQASPYPPELLARYIELVELEAVMCEAPDGIDRYEANTAGRELLRPGDPLGNRSGGRRQPRKKDQLDQFELDAIRVMDRKTLPLPDSDYQPWWNYSSDGKRIAPARAEVYTPSTSEDTPDAKDDHAI